MRTLRSVLLGSVFVWCCSACVAYGELPPLYPADATGSDVATDAPSEEPDIDDATGPGEPDVVEADCGPCPLGFVCGMGSDCAFDESIIGDLITSYTEGGFVRVNDPDFTQQFGPEIPRHVYVSETTVEISPGITDTAAAIYAAIDPEDPEATITAPMPVGTVIVHGVPHADIGDLTDEHIELGLDLRGVMVKRKPGFHPEDNDWWFSRFTVAGQEVPQEEFPPPPDEEDPTDEESMYGMTCIDCHGKDDRGIRTDLLWGVPRLALPP